MVNLDQSENVRGSKRGSTEESQQQPRRKREKYAVLACNECKKRKAKCSGEDPCQRCANLHIVCAYVPNPSDTSNQNHSGRFEEIDTKISKLQRQVSQLLDGMAELRKRSGPSSPSVTRTPIDANRVDAEPTSPGFIGPTTSAFSFGVANSSLQSMGVQPKTMHNLKDPRGRSKSQVKILDQNMIMPPQTDPIWLLDAAEVPRLICLYDEDLSSIYPFLDNERLQTIASVLYGTSSSQFAEDQFNGKDVDLLKIVLASALVLEELGHSELGARLIDSLENPSARIQDWNIDVKDALILTALSIYHFHHDEEVLAWRTIGFAARICLEIGLHRRESTHQNVPDGNQRYWATRLFWCVYVLDRRWSFGTGMPFAIQDSDVDPELDQPEDSPYLTCLIEYGRLGSKVWRAVSGYESNNSKAEDCAFLDFKVQRWLQNIPAELQLIHPNSGRAADVQDRGAQRLRVLLHVRGNNMRILLHRKNLLSATKIMENLAGAQLVVDIAKDSIRVLIHLDRTTNIYQTEQPCFNYFLVAALAVLFLAVCNAPLQFNESCRDEFYMALDLVKRFSVKSFISRRLWKTIKGLKHIGPEIGMTSSSTTQVGNGGLANGTAMSHVHNAGIPALDQHTAWMAPMNNGFAAELFPESGLQMYTELTNLFEAANGLFPDPTLHGSAAGGDGKDGSMQNGENGEDNDFHFFENNEDVSRLIGNLF